MRTLPIFLLTICVLVCVVACNQGQTNTASNTTVSKVLNKAEFAAKIKNTPNVQLVDVRTPDEIAAGSIPNALHIDFNGSDFENQMLTKLDKAKPVLVFCRSGGRSGKTAKMLQKAGFAEIYDLDGGYLNWSK